MGRSDERWTFGLGRFDGRSRNDKHVLDLFTKELHHCGITVLYLCQDLFPPGRFAKSISLNGHYVIAFKNPYDKSGLRALLLQVFPDSWRERQELASKN